MKSNKLPLVEYVSANVFGNTDLSKCILIACQHILLPQYLMFKHFFKKGLRVSDTYLLGKCYSTDKEALDLFIKSGVHVDKNSESFDSHKSYDEQYASHVEDFLIRISRSVKFTRYEKVILLDDGGFLLAFANKYLKNFNNVIGIEQTSSGYNLLSQIKLNFPVINIARSNAKLIYETPIIIKQFIKNIKYELKILNKNPKNILVIGKGVIGDGIVRKLGKQYDIKSYDLLSSERDIEDLESNIHKFDLIIGCSGKSSLPLSLYSKLKRNAILASVSSSDREFLAPHLRLLTEKYTNCHKNVNIRDITLLNSGFPVTFTDYNIGSSEKDMQLTMALLFSGVCLSHIIERENKLVDLDKNIQDIIVRNFKELINKRGNEI